MACSPTAVNHVTLRPLTLVFDRHSHLEIRLLEHCVSVSRSEPLDRARDGLDHFTADALFVSLDGRLELPRRLPVVRELVTSLGLLPLVAFHRLGDVSLPLEFLQDA